MSYRTLLGGIGILLANSACDPRSLLGTSFSESIPACESPALSLKTAIFDPASPEIRVTCSMPVEKLVLRVVQGDQPLRDSEQMQFDQASTEYWALFAAIPKSQMDSSAVVTLLFIRSQKEGSCLETHTIPIKK